MKLAKASRGIIRECDRCDWNYMTIGEIPIRLSQHRPAHTDPKTLDDDEPKKMHGVCPLHPKGGM
jgi:hypothetical protein